MAVAEVSGWIAVSFTIFLGLRILSILLGLVNLGACTDSCDAGPQALPIALFTFGLGWLPMVLVSFVRAARRSRELWSVPHAIVVVLAHAGAMILVVRIFAEFSDADTRTGILASGAAVFDLVTGVLLLLGARLAGEATAAGGEPQA
ncbi:MAG: hypothetical protein ACR2MY_02715 [Candidatus Dormibacteria bacterium]